MRKIIRIKQAEKEKLKNEREKLQIDKDTVKNSRDFKEITLAITLLAGIGAIFLKILDYFTNHAIDEKFTDYIISISSILIVILIMLIIFFLLKGYLTSLKYRDKKIETVTEYLLKNIFVFSIMWFLLLIFISLTSIFIGYKIVWTLFIFFWTFLSLGIFYYLYSGVNLLERSKLKENIHNINSNHQYLIFTIGLFSVLIISLYVPQYLLLGSFSIEELQQSDGNKDIKTFIIKETGITYNNNYISLNKMNIDSNILQSVDTIIINRTQEARSKNKIMLGIRYDLGIWYLNINTSNLSSGNYLLHAEVTNDISKSVRKRGDKLFYIIK